MVGVSIGEVRLLAGRTWFTLGLGFADARLTTTGEALPRIPPLRGTLNVGIHPLSFERLEVVKGPATLLFGSNAMGGVVNAVSGHAGFISHPDGVQGYLQGSASTAYATLLGSPDGTGLGVSASHSLPGTTRWGKIEHGSPSHDTEA